MLLLFNIVLFGFFQDATSQAVQSVVAQEGIVRKISSRGWSSRWRP